MFFAEQSQNNVADEPELPQQINYSTESRLSNITVSDITVYNILKELVSIKLLDAQLKELGNKLASNTTLGSTTLAKRQALTRLVIYY